MICLRSTSCFNIFQAIKIVKKYGRKYQTTKYRYQYKAHGISYVRDCENEVIRSSLKAGSLIGLLLDLDVSNKYSDLGQ